MLKTQCEAFTKPGWVLSKTRAVQINTLSNEADVYLLLCCNESTFNDVEYTLWMFKTIMHHAMINSMATPKVLQVNLRELPPYIEMINGVLEKVHVYVDKHYSQLIARGTTLDDAIGILLMPVALFPATTSRATLFTNRSCTWMETCKASTMRA